MMVLKGASAQMLRINRN